MRHFLALTLALIAGFLGGLLSSARSVDAKPTSESTVRATRFELVDQDGNVLSFWGMDKQKNLVLTFQRSGERVAAGPEVQTSQTSVRSEAVATGLYKDGSPFFEMRGKDGNSRVQLYLTEYEKPMLFMRDQANVRVSLGLDQSDTHQANDDNWSLTFHPDKASIGMHVDPRAKDLKGMLWVEKKTFR